MTEKVQNGPLLVTLRQSRRVSCGDSSVACAPSEWQKKCSEWQKGRSEWQNKRGSDAVL